MRFLPSRSARDRERGGLLAPGRSTVLKPFSPASMQSVDDLANGVSEQIGRGSACKRPSRGHVAERASPDPLLFRAPDARHFASGLLCGVYAERTEEPRKMREPRADITEAEQQVPVDGKAERLVDASADAIPDRSPPEQRFLWHIVGERQHAVVMRRKQPAPDFIAVFVDDDPIAVDDVDARVLGEMARDRPKRARQQQIVGIEPAHDIAVDQRKALVQRIREAAVALRHDAADVRAGRGRDRECCVAGAPVLHDVIERGIALTRDACNRSRHEGLLVEYRRHDGEAQTRRIAGNRIVVDGCQRTRRVDAVAAEPDAEQAADHVVGHRAPAGKLRETNCPSNGGRRIGYSTSRVLASRMGRGIARRAVVGGRWRIVRIAALALDAYGDQVLRQPLLSALLDAGNDVTLLMHPRYADLAPYLDARLAVRRHDIDLSTDFADEAVLSRLRACVADIEAIRPDIIVGLRYDRTAIDEWLLRSCPFAERVAYFPANRGVSLVDDLELPPAAQPVLPFDSTVTQPLAVANRTIETARYEKLFHALTGSASSLPLPRLATDDAACSRALDWIASTPIAGRRFVIVAPAGTSNHSFKRMPTHLAVAAIETMWREHRISTVLTGIESEIPHLAEVAAALPDAGEYVATWVGRAGSLADLLGLVTAAEAYVGADLGTMHFAGALDRPVVALFGGGHYPRFQPAARRWAAVTKRLPCFGCEWHCVFDRIRCIDEVSVDAWLKAVRLVLAGESPGWILDPAGLDEVSARAAEPEVARIRAILDDVEGDRFERLVRIEAQDAAVRDLQAEVQRIGADSRERLDALVAADREISAGRATIRRLQQELDALRRESERLRADSNSVADPHEKQG